MCIKPRIRRDRAFTFLEVVVASAVMGLVAVAVGSVYVYSLYAFAAMSNYADLDEKNRHAMDYMIREIRQSREVTDFSSNSISIINGDAQSITYMFSPSTKKLIRSNATAGKNDVLLDSCSLLNFNLYQRNPKGGSYNIYPVATNNWRQTVKVVQLSWKSSRVIPGPQTQSENIQTARIVIRKQH